MDREQTDRAFEAARDHAQRQQFSQAVAQEWVDKRKLIWSSAPPQYGWCACAGPSQNLPLCHCQMLDVIEVNDRLIHVRDVGGIAVCVDVGAVPG
jgi:hypothetical protein